MMMMMLSRSATSRRRSLIVASARVLSSTAAAAAAASREAAAVSKPDNDGSSSPPPPSQSPPLSRTGTSASAIPTRHSHKKLPVICTDADVRRDLTHQVLAAPVGSLFRYANGQDSSAAAWDAADATVQKVEFILRGHAHTLSGTTWNRWLVLPSNTTATTSSSHMSSDQINESLQTMQQLMDRLWEEGYSYMQLRAARLEEKQGPKVNAHAVVNDNDDDTEELEIHSDNDDDNANNNNATQARQVVDNINALQDDTRKFSRDQGMDPDEDSDSSSSSDSDTDADNKNNEATGIVSDATYMEDFSVPGPTTHMYDTLLDAMACQASVASSTIVSARQTYLMFEDLLMRHELDGGDDANTSFYTRPTAQSYNAAIRVAAELPYDINNDQSQSPSNQKYRDESIHLAFSVFDALSDSRLVARNSATYTYLLKVVAKYFPASRSRGHIARGMVLHARDQGLVDRALAMAYQQANEPSNGDEEFAETLALLNRSAGELPHKWKANNRRLRNHPREATY